jgi:hypothetical protein
LPHPLTPNLPPNSIHTVFDTSLAAAAGSAKPHRGKKTKDGSQARTGSD